MLLPLALVLALAPPPGSVELGRGSWRALHPPGPADVVVPAWAAERTVRLEPAPGGVLLRATWAVRSLSSGAWFSGQVLGDIPGARLERVAWNGQPVAVATRPDGVRVAARVDGRAVLELVAFIPGEPTREPLALDLLPAVRGRVEVRAPEGLTPHLRAHGPPPRAPPREPAPVATGESSRSEATREPAASEPAAQVVPPPDSIVPLAASDVLRLGPAFSSGAARLELSFVAAPASPQDRRAVVVARAGLGLTLGDADLRGRARLVWEVRQGSLDAVAFSVAGVGPDLEVRGPGVRAVRRDGDAVRVELQAPVAGRLELDAAWTSAIAKSAESRAELPRFTFLDVFRSEATLQIARDGEVEAVPTTTDWTPTTAAALPAWGQGLVEGTPTAAFRAGTSPAGHLDLLRFVPLEGPPVVIDVAAYTVATSREGRALVRAHYEVRNERAASLRVRPPPGFEVLGVRVGGATATPARDHDGAWRIPLQRSVETVSGLLSFPVEVALLGGDDVAWRCRERRALALPQLDAPVAVARVTLHLPPGYSSRLGPGDGDVVPAFTRGEGITYGLGVGAVGAAEADAAFQSAVKYWLANDFNNAQAELDRLKAMGASNENITRLQGNLDVIAGRGAKDEGNAQRRIREQAKARSIADQKLQEDLRQQAAQSREAGDYAAAESQYQAAIAVGDRLAKLEQKESVEQQTRNVALQQELQSSATEFKARKKQSTANRRRAGRVRSKAAVDTSFESDELAVYREHDAPTPGARDTTTITDEESGELDAAGRAPAAKSPPAAGDVEKSGAPDDAARAPAAESDALDDAAAVDVAESDAPDDAARAPAAGRDDAGTPPAGTTGAESQYVVDGVSVRASAQPAPPPPPEPTNEAPARVTVEKAVRISGTSAAESVDLEVSAVSARPRVFQRLAGVARGRGRFGARRTKSAPPAPPPATSAEKPKEQPPELAGLPAPVATASAVSVVVPQVGRAVLYQRLLLPADAVHTIDVSAREPLIRRDSP
ncbi:MAG: hypothetical protein JNL82_27780 [Myxococcales bacterium]|nr:hypothetical protein [Myxococcales bacterium]